MEAAPMGASLGMVGRETESEILGLKASKQTTKVNNANQQTNDCQTSKTLAPTLGMQHVQRVSSVDLPQSALACYHLNSPTTVDDELPA